MVYEKVIFADVDGVLNTLKTVEQYGFHYIDNVLLTIFEQIVKKTQAKVVISSAWRMYPDSRKVIKREFNYCGLEVLDWTPNLPNNPRRDEIQAWIDKNPVAKFAIIDDDWDAAIDGSFFKVDEKFGITVKIADAVVEHLGTPSLEIT